jgi:predicted ribosome quality control (RQC) complex YloA/Tae2 family protein
MANHSASQSAISRGESSVAPNDGAQLDSAGQAILKLLHKAAGAAEANSRRALETTQKLSSELHAAQNRIAELEAQLQLYRERAERAEEWLSRISAEIEDRFIKEPAERRREAFR